VSDFADRNAEQVHAFALQIGNLGLSRVADLLLAMFESGAWHQFQDGTGTFRFLPGEFDYFLTQQGVTRDHVMHGVRDVQVKARLEEAMDERRTGEDGYRRRLADVRDQVPQRPGRDIEPFGYTAAEGRELTGRKGSAREALGRAPRQLRLSGGVTTKRPNELASRVERLHRSVLRLDDVELAAMAEAISQEQARRSRPATEQP
jgi:outer membrane murein-binding lipoprotein Lpp